MAKAKVPSVGGVIYVEPGTGRYGGKAVVSAVEYVEDQKAHFVTTRQTGQRAFRWEGSLDKKQEALKEYFGEEWAREDPDDVFEF